MPAVKFVKEFNVAPEGHTVVTFPVGQFDVTEEVAAKAVAAGAAQRVQQSTSGAQTKAKQGAAGGGAKVGTKGNKSGGETSEDGGQ